MTSLKINDPILNVNERCPIFIFPRLSNHNKLKYEQYVKCSPVYSAGS